MAFHPTHYVRLTAAVGKGLKIRFIIVEQYECFNSSH